MLLDAPNLAALARSVANRQHAFVAKERQRDTFIPEPDWQPAVSWLWLPASVLVTGNLVLVLVAWCIDGIRNIGRWDGRIPLLAFLALVPFLAWGATYFIALRGWRHRTGRAFVATLGAAPAAFLALLYRGLMSGGM